MTRRGGGQRRLIAGGRIRRAREERWIRTAMPEIIQLSFAAGADLWLVRVRLRDGRRPIEVRVDRSCFGEIDFETFAEALRTFALAGVAQPPGGAA